jgi:hypothetical protein
MKNYNVRKIQIQPDKLDIGSTAKYFGVFGAALTKSDFLTSKNYTHPLLFDTLWMYISRLYQWLTTFQTGKYDVLHENVLTVSRLDRAILEITDALQKNLNLIVLQLAPKSPLLSIPAPAAGLHRSKNMEVFIGRFIVYDPRYAFDILKAYDAYYLHRTPLPAGLSEKMLPRSEFDDMIKTLEYLHEQLTAHKGIDSKITNINVNMDLFDPTKKIPITNIINTVAHANVV